MKNQTATLRDVAKLAGVSVGTVSKYFNNPETLKEKNRTSIADSIQTLNYTPNDLAQRLARGQANVILLYIIAEKDIASSTWLYELPLIKVINDRLENSKYNLQIKIGDINKPQDVHAYLQSCIKSKNIDGALILSAWPVSSQTILSMVKRDFPFILIDNYDSAIGFNQVVSDNEAAVSNLIEYLHETGHKKIQFYGVDTDQQHMQDRISGFKKSTHRHHFTDAECILCNNFDIASGKLAASEQLKKGPLPDAILCGNDNIAIGCIHALQENGFQVPKDVSVVGIDNSILSQAITPSLTTVALPMAKMGSVAIESLLSCIEDPSLRLERVVLPSKIIYRNSVQKRLP